MTQDKAEQVYEASFYLDRAVVNRALAVLSGNGDATSTVGAMLRDMERMALELRRSHLETERVTVALREIYGHATADNDGQPCCDTVVTLAKAALHPTPAMRPGRVKRNA